MPDNVERIITLEAQMGQLLQVVARLDGKNEAREEKQSIYQLSILKQLTQIEGKLDQSSVYQKTCDAERDAVAKRLIPVENDLDKIKTILNSITGTIKDNNTDIDSLKNDRIKVRAQAGLIATIISFAVALAGIFFAGKIHD